VYRDIILYATFDYYICFDVRTWENFMKIALRRQTGWEEPARVQTVH